jgi:ElaB/YqjD/DUF883 family membrane-anchored ribosome-binding protein
MSQATEADIQALVSELKNLRSDFARIGEILKDTARHGGADAADRVRGQAERGWTTARSKAQTLVDEMEERPFGTAMVVFIAGLLLGLIVGGRR